MLRKVNVAYYDHHNMLYIHLLLPLQEDRIETQEKKLSWQPEKDTTGSR
jgi:hypothetical protein